MSKYTPVLLVLSLITPFGASLIGACKDADRGTLRRWRHVDASTDTERDAGTADASDADSADAAAALEASVERWVGTVDDSDIRLGAVIENGDRARLFFCGGASTYATATRWISLTLAADGGFEFDDGGWTVRGTRSGVALAGTVQQNGESRRFSALRIATGTIAGLYEGTADCGRVGLIVAQPDSNADPTAQGACVGDGHPPEQVNPILPVSLEDGAIRVKIGELESVVRAAAPAPKQ
jgi:hypothetical protein